MSIISSYRRFHVVIEVTPAWCCRNRRKRTPAYLGNLLKLEDHHDARRATRTEQ